MIKNEMQWELVLAAYIVTVVYLLVKSERAAYREIKSSQCLRKTFYNLEYYECTADDYYAYKTLDGKRVLFSGNYEDKHAYYHELAHLIYDKFWLDTILGATLIIPLLILPTPWAWIGALIVYIAGKWVKKNEERRADLFAYEMTKLKYTPIKLEKNKIELLLKWLFWGHPPDRIRIEEEYYKKEIPLCKLFFRSLL